MLEGGKTDKHLPQEFYKCLPFKYSSIVSESAIVWHFDDPRYEKNKKKGIYNKINLLPG